MKPQTVQIVRQGEATLYWFLLIHYTKQFIGDDEKSGLEGSVCLQNAV
ncbi:transposase [Neisseria meningitidis]|nr:transposase [Neisseria meningitidis]